MELDLKDVLGYSAGLITISSFLFQVIKTIRTRDTSGISLSMYIFYVSGILLWLVYSILIHQPVMIFANTISLILGMIMLIMKIKYK